ncbi:MAG: Crp/Fnr family transcriptional regulator [Anaerolineae bacterium]|nr:MAG: Crp/Fnr family transcriptional regulator [Anaerolineae bacterium]
MRTLKVSLTEKLNALRVNTYFDELDRASLERVAAHTHLRLFKRGEVLFREGEECAGLHIIRRGSVKLYRLAPNGRQYIVRVLQEGETCNEVPVFDGGTNPVNVEALEETSVWVIEPTVLRELLLESPEFARKVIANFATNLRNLVHMASEMAFYQVTHRLARLISRLPPEELSGEKGRLTQEQIAARLGTVREVVARSLRELERSGAIRVERSRIYIADSDILAHWAEGPWN